MLLWFLNIKATQCNSISNMEELASNKMTLPLIMIHSAQKQLPEGSEQKQACFEGSLNSKEVARTECISCFHVFACAVITVAVWGEENSDSKSTIFLVRETTRRSQATSAAEE